VAWRGVEVVRAGVLAAAASATVMAISGGAGVQEVEKKRMARSFTGGELKSGRRSKKGAGAR